MTGCPVHHHGMTKARGCGHVAVSRFGTLFNGKLKGLAVTEADAAFLGGPGGLMHDYDGGSPNCPIPAGYIFFSQFIDHDITLDTTSKLRAAPLKPDSIKALPNVRSASLDLDCVYGFGPDGSPHLYDSDRPGRLAVASNGHDVARSPGGVALIGDPRNDENIFVSQMQLMWHRFHNKLYNERVTHHGESEKNRFELAQESTRFHYQWLVLFDLLKRLCDRETYIFAVSKLMAGTQSFPCFHKPGAHGLDMPVEFSVAAYRVGHTLVRSAYAVNESNLDVELFDERFGTLGFTSYPEELIVDWRYMLPVDDCVNPRLCKAVDPLLANELQDLPVVGSNNPNDRALAFRNLMRGNALSLPSGQAVAKALKAKYPHIDASYNPSIPGKPSLAKATPLFYYILAESKDTQGGDRLGAVGSAILLEVFGAMLRFCGTSFVSKNRDWNPDPCVSKERYGWWSEEHKELFDRDALVNEDDYYPFELADVVRFVEGMD